MPDDIDIDLDDDYESESATPVVAPRSATKRVIAVGGGRGGVGKSVLTVNLAVYFAQLGRSVGRG